MVQHFSLIKIRQVPSGNINEELQWLGNSLGLFNLRDKDSSCFRVFITLVKRVRDDQALSSDKIAEKLHLSRGTVVHHLRRLMESGIIVREKEGYFLREETLQKLISDLRQDWEAVFAELREVAQEIDEKLGYG